VPLRDRLAPREAQTRGELARRGLEVSRRHARPSDHRHDDRGAERHDRQDDEDLDHRHAEREASD